MDSTARTLTLLMRAAMGHTEGIPAIPDGTDWKAVLKLAEIQHVTALAYDGIRQLGIPLDEETRLLYVGHLMLTENAYRHHLLTLTKLARFYHRHGIGMMLLKGYGMSLLYPTPEHRAPGDLDIFLWNLDDPERKSAYRKADQLIEQELGIPVDQSHEHHTVFLCDGVTVENHYDFINVVDLRSSKAIEKELKEAVLLPLHRVESGGTPLYLPSAQFNSLFLSRHMARHFTGSGTNLRQLLDWANFLKQHHDEIDWSETVSFWQNYGLFPFMTCINSICIGTLGYPSDFFHGITSSNNILTQKILDDLLNPATHAQTPIGKVRSLIFRLRRFNRNGWKRRITYTDNSLSAFLTLLWAHLKRHEL